MPELDAFALFVRLMEEAPARPHARRYGLRPLFTPQMNGLHLILHQHSELVRLFLPNLHSHFLLHGVLADTYASPWFLTVFTYNFPLPLVLRIFDIIFAEGAFETMLKFSIALLNKNQDRLLEENDLEGILEFLKGDQLYKAYEDDPENLVQDAMALSGIITEAVLDKLATNWHEETKSKLALEKEGSDLRMAMERLAAENFKLSKEVGQLRSLLRSAEDRRLRDLRALQEEYEAELEGMQ
jgi:hypothetical protein